MTEPREMYFVNFNAYQDFVWKLASDDSKSSFEDMITTAALGLAGESGEVSDIIKKHLYQGKEFNEDDLKLEAGDVLWYLCFLCKTMNWTLEEVATENMRKLTVRYGERANA